MQCVNLPEILESTVLAGLVLHPPPPFSHTHTHILSFCLYLSLTLSLSHTHSLSLSLSRLQVSLPDSGLVAVPTSVDMYMKKLHSMLVDPAQASSNEGFLLKVKEIMASIDLEG